MVDEPGAPAGSHGTGVTVACRYYGRDFTTDEMALIRALITTEPTRAAIARAFCQRTGWLKPDGGLKFMMAKVTMLAMHRDGLITLPPPRWRPGPRKPIVFGQDTEPPLFAPPCYPRRGTASRCLHRRQRHPGRKAVERVRRPLPLSGIHNPGRRPDALRRPRPQRMARRHARLLHRRMETRTARHLHRMDTRVASEKPATRHRQPALPHPALDSSRQSRVPHPRHHAPPPAR